MKTDRIVFLENEIKKHDELYWIENNPAISDIEYDALVTELLSLNPDNEYLNKPKTPKVNSTGKVAHKIPMLSLDKAYSFDEILKWCEKVKRSDDEMFKIMFKYDGVSGHLEDGVLSTRGDGLIGEDITNKLPFIQIVHKGDPSKIRGEILFTKSDFKKIKGIVTRKSGEDYKNERNAVGGILSRDDLKPSKILTFIDFDYFYIKQTYSKIKEQGLSWWNDIIFSAKNLEYPTDGLVIKLDDEEYADSLGATSHHSRSSIAFKFDNPFVWTILREIEFSPGKHDITPVGKVDPIEISGVTITSPSLHNWKNIIDRDLQIGDEVKVERAGDVIPYISDSRPGLNRKPIIIPLCPICNSEVIYKDPQITCSNPDCSGKLVNKLADSVIRIGIERLGRPTIQKMIDTFKVENLLDIFNLSIENLRIMERMGEISTKNLFEEIQKIKNEGVYEWQLLASLNIQGIGSTISKKLLLGRTLQDLAQLSTNELESIPDIGPERANLLIRGLNENFDYIERLKEILPIKQSEIKKEGQIKVCFTGSFPEKKQYYYNLLQQNGNYEILEKVSGIDILVVADPSKKSTKQQIAEKKSIKIIGINELLNSL